MTRPIDRLLRLRVLVAATTMAFAAPALAGRINTTAVKTGGSYDQFIVRFNSNTPERGNASARQRLLDGIGRGNGVAISQLRRLAVGADVIRTSRRLDSIAAKHLMARLAKNPHVDYVELDARKKPAFTPNDTNYSSQWHYWETTAGIRAPSAWDHATGTGVVVAVVDTGITPHSDLSANVITGYDFISDPAAARDSNGRDSNPNDEGDWLTTGDCGDSTTVAQDSSWHGTHVAGTIAAVTNNAKGVAGVAFNAKVEPVRVLGECGGTTSDIADGIIWAAGGSVPGIPANANPAEVINMSLGGPGACDFTSQAAIDFAVSQGTVVVVAAGNDFSDASGFNPANCDNVITVAALGRDARRASYSNFGSAVDISAPGGDDSITDSVLSTINMGSTTQGAEGYAGYQGTSMATPHVAGVVALMQSVHANTPAFIEAIIKKSARAFLPTTPCTGCGAGIVDANAAVLAASTPTLIIDDVKLTEGNSGTKLATFTVRLSQAIGSDITFDIATANGTALAGTDYVASSLTGQTIPSGQTSKSFSVTINGDTSVENDETFVVNVSNVVAAGVSVADAQGQGTILNEDAVALTNGVSVLIPTANADRQFLYSLDVPSGATNLSFDTSGGTGDADLYVKFGSPPTLSSADCVSGSETTTEHCGLTTPQAGRYYVMVNAFSNISGVSIVGSYTGGSSQPSLSIGDVSISEGNSGTKIATFTVSLSGTSANAVTYDIATTNGSATAGSDYVANSLGGESIPAGQTSKTFAVTINGDTTLESNETYLVNVTNVSGATVADSQATGTITNDDVPSLSISDASISEGNAGTKLLSFTVHLSQAAATGVTYNIATSNGTATAGSDYVASSLNGQLIPAGNVSKSFNVTLNGDTTIEPNETFTVTLSNPSGATISDAQATGTISNDDVPSLSIGDASISEGNAGTKLLSFTVHLSQAATTGVTYNIATANGTATAGSDYVASSLSGQLIPAGNLSKSFNVTLNGDTAIEANETFTATISNPSGATIADAQATGTISNDDVPSLSISDAAISEGNSGTKTLVFTVHLSQAASTGVTYNIATSNGTATAGSDYVANSLSGQLIPAGNLSKNFSVTLNGDTTIEPNETIKVTLSNPSGATISDAQATGTISNDDVPSLSISDAAINEGNSGTKTLVFTVHLSQAASTGVTYNIATANGTATAGSDYVANSLNAQLIPAGSVSKLFSVTINGDATVEPNETFTATLSSPSGAAISDNQATGTINNDD